MELKDNNKQLIFVKHLIFVNLTCQMIKKFQNKDRVVVIDNHNFKYKS